MSFVDHDGLAKCGCHAKTHSRNYTMYKNYVLICISVDNNYRLGGTRMHSKAFGFIPWHSAAFQGTRLHFMVIVYIPRHSAAVQGTQLGLG
jgi:hypothetical protein